MAFTLKDQPHTLCDSCRNVRKTQFRSGRLVRTCNEMTSDQSRDILREPVDECSMYEAMGQMSSHEAHLIGWILRPGDHGVIGFVPPKRH